MAAPTTSLERRERLVELFRELRDCHACPLAASRTQVVFGAGNADAELMFVGEAPGRHEDEQGLPFVGRAGGLLDELLAGVGLARRDVFITNVLKCLGPDAPVQLADGSWERIGRLVGTGYAGEVMSVDAAGRLVPRRVVGWHATPLGGRRVFRLSYRSARDAGPHRAGVELTGDHPVLTPRGYVAVDDLRPGDQVATGQGLSPVAFDVACGMLLGDGSHAPRSAQLGFDHSERQAEYARFKAGLLRELRPSVAELEVAAVAGGPRAHEVVEVRTIADRALGVLRRHFHAGGKVVPPWLATQLNGRMLAIWFMDDGHLRVQSHGMPCAEIATHGFDATGLQTVLRGLERLGLGAAASHGRISFGVDSTVRLCERIAPYVPPAMRDELHPDVERRVPFDPGRLEPDLPRVLFDDVDMTDVTARHRGGATFFCIDVEETGNFVTAGGVVHNCRPPGNRDPLPEEIELCKPYLFDQIRLIEPRVVCTLGNFATKLLTRSNRGITSVHGRAQEHELGGRRVRLLPLFHPAAALRTPATLAALRADFATLPALLAEPLPPPGAVAVPTAGPPPAPEPVAPPQLGLFG